MVIDFFMLASRYQYDIKKKWVLNWLNWTTRQAKLKYKTSAWIICIDLNDTKTVYKEAIAVKASYIDR